MAYLCRTCNLLRMDEQKMSVVKTGETSHTICNGNFLFRVMKDGYCTFQNNVLPQGLSSSLRILNHGIFVKAEAFTFHATGEWIAGA